MISMMRSRAGFSILCAFVMGGGLSLHAADPGTTKRTVLTVSQTVQIGNAVLPPGQYVIKRMDSDSSTHVVQISDRAETHVIASVVTAPVERTVAHGHTMFTYYETPAGAVHALRTWYYPGDQDGDKFIEPKHHEMLAENTSLVDEPLSFGEYTASQPQQ